MNLSKASGPTEFPDVVNEEDLERCLRHTRLGDHWANEILNGRVRKGRVGGKGPDELGYFADGE